MTVLSRNNGWPVGGYRSAAARGRSGFHGDPADYTGGGSGRRPPGDVVDAPSPQRPRRKYRDRSRERARRQFRQLMRMLRRQAARTGLAAPYYLAEYYSDNVRQWRETGNKPLDAALPRWFTEEPLLDVIGSRLVQEAVPEVPAHVQHTVPAGWEYIGECNPHMPWPDWHATSGFSGVHPACFTLQAGGNPWPPVTRIPGSQGGYLHIAYRHIRNGTNPLGWRWASRFVYKRNPGAGSFGSAGPQQVPYQPAQPAIRRSAIIPVGTPKALPLNAPKPNGPTREAGYSRPGRLRLDQGDSPSRVVETGTLPGFISPPGGNHTIAPPGRGVKESKHILAMDNGSWLGRIVGFTGEVVDFIGAIYKALPPEVRRQYGSNPTPQVMLEALYRHHHRIDWGEAFVNIIGEQIEDRFYGELGKLAGRAARIMRTSTGIQVGWMRNARYVQRAAGWEVGSWRPF